MNDREMNFCINYVENGGRINDAGLKAGYSAKYMNSHGHEFLKRPQIVERIQRLRSKMEKQVLKGSVDVVNQISKHAFAEILDYVKVDPDHPGNYIGKSPEELTADQRAAVASFECIPVWTDDKKTTIKRYEYRYTLHDQSGALIQMGRHFGIFDDKLRITNGGSNRFANLSPEKLAELRAQIIKYMHSATNGNGVIEGEFSERPQKMLSDDRRS